MNSSKNSEDGGSRKADISGDTRDTPDPDTADTSDIVDVPETRRQKKSRVKSRTGKSVLLTFEAPVQKPTLKLFYENIDVTPNRIKTEQHTSHSQKIDLDNETTASRKSKVISRTSSILLARESKNQSVAQNRITTQLSLDKIKIDKDVKCEVGNIPEKQFTAAPSAFYLPKMSSKVLFPREMKVVLEETDTIYLFEISSITVAKGTDEGDLVEKENEFYDYLTIGKGRNRKTITTEAQTLASILKTRHTVAARTQKVNNSAFASVWDMFDSYGSLEKTDNFIDPFDSVEFEESNQKRTDSLLSKEEFDLKTIFRSLAFRNAVMMMERILANNNFNLEQEDFKGLVSSDSHVLEENYEYKLILLWTFGYHKIDNRTVTAMCINTGNSDIVGVGYGKFEYADTNSGIICIWSIKNPTQPEKLYNFEIPITSMAFSNDNPSLLAIGFYNGDVSILDITSFEKKVVVSSSRQSSPTFQPVWHVRWFHAQDFHPDVEQVIAIGQDGRINCFLQTKTKDFVCAAMMRIIRTDSNIKTGNIYEEDWCPTNDIPILRNTIGHFYCPHPTSPDIYFAGTSDGYVYKCSTNYVNQHISFFLAHDGPVYGMQFSHYCKTIFLTCGADWTVKVWKEDVFLPLVVLTTEDMNPIMGTVFCPTHSTIIAAVSGTSVYIWNIRQKIDTAILVLKMPENLSKLTKVLFTKNGKNLIVSDIKGGVHMFSLLGVAQAEDFQDKILEDTLHKILSIRPQVLDQIRKANKAIK